MFGMLVSVVHSAASALASLSLVSATSISPSHMHTRSHSQAKSSISGADMLAPDAKPTPVAISGRRAAPVTVAKSMPTRDFDSGSVVGDEIEVDVEDDDSASVMGFTPASGKRGKGRKRANIFKCESCSKVCILYFSVLADVVI